MKGTAGLLDYVKKGNDPEHLSDGGYLMKYPTLNGVRISVDRGGSELLFLYESSDYWCVSTSFMLLCEEVRFRKRELTLNTKVFSNFFIQTSLYEQPISDDLVFNEIKLVDQRFILEASERGVSFVLRDDSDLESFKSLSYEDKLDFFSSYYKSLFKSLSVNSNVSLELSGGVDSRVMLSLCKPMVQENDIRVSTDKNRKEDFFIASSLSNIYGFTFDDKEPYNTGFNELSKKYLLFKYSTIGISRTNKRPNSHSGLESSSFIRLNGGGGEASKIFYNINSVAYENVLLKSGLTDDYKHMKINELRGVLESNGYNDDPVSAMVDIYTKYRNRFFAGRAWYYNLLGLIISPFSSIYFSELIKSEDLPNFFETSIGEVFKKNLIQLHLLLLSDPSLAIVCFDTKDKSFEVSDLLHVQSKLSRCTSTKLFNIQSFVDDEEECNSQYIKDCESEGGYESLIRSDISNNLDEVFTLGILDAAYIDEIRHKFENNKLSKAEELSLLNAASIVELATRIDYVF